MKIKTTAKNAQTAYIVVHSELEHLNNLISEMTPSLPNYYKISSSLKSILKKHEKGDKVKFTVPFSWMRMLAGDKLRVTAVTYDGELYTIDEFLEKINTALIS